MVASILSKFKAPKKKGTGAHSPIDRIVEVICSNLNGPMTRNRYLVRGMNHQSNYCRVFLACTNDRVANAFEHLTVRQKVSREHWQVVDVR